MIISLIAVLLFGGNALNVAVSKEDYKETKAEIMIVMQDIEQRQEVIRVLYGLKRKSKNYSKRYIKHFKPLLKELKEYDAQISDVLDEELAVAHEIRLEWYNEIIAARFAIRNLMKREEWEAVFGI